MSRAQERPSSPGVDELTSIELTRPNSSAMARHLLGLVSVSEVADSHPQPFGEQHDVHEPLPFSGTTGEQ